MTIVSIAFPGLDPESAICALEGVQLNVGRSCALDGVLVIAALSVTVPENPPEDGVTMMVDVLPVLEPLASVTAVPLTVNPAAPPVTKLWMLPEVVATLFCANA